MQLLQVIKEEIVWNLHQHRNNTYQMYTEQYKYNILIIKLILGHD